MKGNKTLVVHIDRLRLCERSKEITATSEFGTRATGSPTGTVTGSQTCSPTGTVTGSSTGSLTGSPTGTVTGSPTGSRTSSGTGSRVVVPLNTTVRKKDLPPRRSNRARVPPRRFTAACFVGQEFASMEVNKDKMVYTCPEFPREFASRSGRRGHLFTVHEVKLDGKGHPVAVSEEERRLAVEKLLLRHLNKRQRAVLRRKKEVADEDSTFDRRIESRRITSNGVAMKLGATETIDFGALEGFLYELTDKGERPQSTGKSPVNSSSTTRWVESISL